ncbi:hypothetical protein PhaeoP72_01190 [Phaeobacter inhibens]|uniref:hypothetical protein n=1 Tax=Phaeobacter inhibens TaxID=221822 RepID=UPI000CA0A4AB|nr:hypothetical protein [Phaeobacter inhibens]AUR03175.1 hypothetical protein PhaeoP72_01190 [Phaeobacter inhibens]
MAKKIRDVVVKLGQYQDRNTGETKARWGNVGSLMQNEEDKSLFVVLDRTFNPAGVPNPEHRSSLILSCFVPQERQQQGSGQQGGSYGGGQQQGQNGYGSQQGEGSQGGSSHNIDDDEIPF